jgi:hypothetical protein
MKNAAKDEERINEYAKEKEVKAVREGIAADIYFIHTVLILIKSN